MQVACFATTSLDVTVVQPRPIWFPTALPASAGGRPQQCCSSLVSPAMILLAGPASDAEYYNKHSSIIVQRVAVRACMK